MNPLARADLNLFVVFDTILREGSISAASRRLNLSQPAVSHALARLREQLGDPLFQRQGRGMVPTPRARAMAGTLRDALDSLSGLLQGAAGFDPASSRRRFTLAVRDVMEAVLIPPLVKRILKAAPGVELVSTRVDRRRLESELRGGGIDLAIDVLLPTSAAVSREPLLAEPLAIVARHDHPALRRRPDLATYLAQGHVQISSRRAGPGLEDMVLARMGLARDIRLRCQHYATACQVAAASDLLATLPARFARLAAAPYPTRIHPLPLADARLELFLYGQAGAELDPAVLWLRQTCRAIMAPRAAARQAPARATP